MKSNIPPSAFINNISKALLNNPELLQQYYAQQIAKEKARKKAIIRAFIKGALIGTALHVIALTLGAL